MLRELNRNLANNALTGVIPTEIGALIDITTLNLVGNTLSGGIPGTINLLLNLHSFTIDTTSNLCRLDAASTLAAAKCTACSSTPECACTDLAFCPSGGSKSVSTAVNAFSPFYPAEDTTCCPVGNTVRELLVSDSSYGGNLDCAVGRPCIAVTGVPFKGTDNPGM
jgi:hypothetical protein